MFYTKFLIVFKAFLKRKNDRIECKNTNYNNIFVLPFVININKYYILNLLDLLLF